MTDHERTLSDEAMLDQMSSAYYEIKRVRRDLSPSDRLVDDLGLDSLDAIDVLSMLEDEFGGQFLDAVTAELREVSTVGDFLAVIKRHL